MSAAGILSQLQRQSHESWAQLVVTGCDRHARTVGYGAADYSHDVTDARCWLIVSAGSVHPWCGKMRTPQPQEDLLGVDYGCIWSVAIGTSLHRGAPALESCLRPHGPRRPCMGCSAVSAASCDRHRAAAHRHFVCLPRQCTSLDVVIDLSGRMEWWRVTALRS